jgi:hypothetical protein
VDFATAGTDARMGAGTGVGVAAGGVSGCSCTTPAALGPAGAANNWTRYIGGAGGSRPGPNRKNPAINAP